MASTPEITRISRKPNDLASTTESQKVDTEDINKNGEDLGTRYDQGDMARMGKIQELKRNFRPLAALSFASVLQATWEFILIGHTEALVNGGMAGLFWSYTWTFAGFGLIILTMSPTSGGQYHWVSELASPNYQRALSYVTGWMSVLAWQAGAASGSFLTGTIIQGLISVRDPDFESKDWQGTLFVFAMILAIYYFNVYASSWMPRIQNLLLALHILCFVIVITVLWAMAPRQPARAVFLEFSNTGGWSSMGLALMVGQISAIYAGLSSDATAHMSEEVRDAGRYVPMAIAWGFFTNGAMGFMLVITYLFAMPSLEDALQDPTNFPFIYVFKNAVGTAGVNGLTAIILIPVIFSNILFNASAARQTYAFARDRGLPFARWICKVNPKRKLPVNAIGLSCGISGLLALINIGSKTAFHAIISLNVAALMWTYVISIGCLLYRRLSCPETLPPQRWSLGKYGVGVNAAALVYVIFAFFFSFWPSSTPVSLTTFNWSVVIFSSVLIISVIMYIIKGHKEYAGPVTSVRRDGMPQARAN
ncbi:GABA permease [Aspergillus alliaceus]|uniref:GABA permease n=1 Tax=Petromyces alliaceus TaxID=209559 RepID=A0A5N6FGA0_PETAA|nr:GABA permease [Aspergillus alliaceus]KAB8228245.1 GABA permease [Aspergillus alliaceus]KAE8387373.1 GABA permease [Aspergillus alliaceus]